MQTKVLVRQLGQPWNTGVTSRLSVCTEGGLIFSPFCAATTSSTAEQLIGRCDLRLLLLIRRTHSRFSYAVIVLCFSIRICKTSSSAFSFCLSWGRRNLFAQNSLINLREILDFCDVFTHVVSLQSLNVAVTCLRNHNAGHHHQSYVHRIHAFLNPRLRCLLLLSKGSDSSSPRNVIRSLRKGLTVRNCNQDFILTIVAQHLKKKKDFDRVRQ